VRRAKKSGTNDSREMKRFMEKRDEKNRRMTVPDFQKKKKAGQKLTVVTAYDYPGAKLVDMAGIDAILVGDSLGNVVQGRQTTLPVTLEQMIYHAQMVMRAAKHSLVVVDLPFPFCQTGPEKAVEAAATLLKETEADAVKIEGGQARAATIRAVVEAGIPVMGHCGLLPQNIRQFGNYKIQKDHRQMTDDVSAVEAAGAFAVVLELISPELAAKITESASIPMIGIGSGPHTDGQVLVFHDLLGLTDQLPPKHAKCYANLHEIALAAIKKYRNDVETGKFFP